MIFGQRSNQELKYAKVKAKGSEFSVSEDSLPRFPFNSDDLHYSSVYAISTYVSARLKGERVAEGCINDLERAASFYDAVSSERRNREFSDGFWAVAVGAYLLLGNYGSAKVALGQIGDRSFYGDVAKSFLDLVGYLLVPGSSVPSEFLKLDLFMKGCGSKEEALSESEQFRECSAPEDSFFGRIIVVAIREAIEVSARTLLPLYSGLPLDSWTEYLNSNKASKILWQAQQSIGRAGVFGGGNAFIQLPTGSGKTKSIELIIRSRILSGDCSVVAVIAPLRALCSEIANDLSNSLDDIAKVHQTSDVMELDPWIRKLTGEVSVLVFTPEKFDFTIRHEPKMLDIIDLFLFDEAHLLDSYSRGPEYELLLTEILDKKDEAQKVLISAVVANPDQISKWAFGGNGASVSSKMIQVTEKSFGIARPNGRAIDFLDKNTFELDKFFLPVDVAVQDLRQGRERKRRPFPNLGGSGAERSRDLATYYADRLLANGAVAIYLPQRKYIETYFKRLVDLMGRKCKLGSLPDSLEGDEKKKLKYLFELHYGKGNVFSAGIEIGILPHYSDLQGVLRSSVEYALEKGSAKCVACTSTLAQGVNLPIKYLLITSIHNGLTDQKVRDFQNLIGRTARSGRFSEGTVLVLDDVSDSRKMKQYIRLFNPENAEDCKSALLHLVSDIVLPDGRELDGKILVDAILEAIDDKNLETKLKESLMHIGIDERKATREAQVRVRSLEAIESYICDAIVAIHNEEAVEELCRATFAHYTANERLRTMLVKLFRSIYESINSRRNTPLAALCAKTRLGLRAATQLDEIVQQKDFLEFVEAGCEDLFFVARLFVNCSDNIFVKNDPSEIGRVCELWIGGNNLEEIMHIINCEFPQNKPLTISKTEKYVSNGIKFSLSHFVSAMIDAMGSHPDKFAENDIHPLSVLQKKLKYGVGCLREIALCEELFDDRMIVREIVKVIGADGNSQAGILRDEIIDNSEEINEMFNSYPSFCRKRLSDWLFESR